MDHQTHFPQSPRIRLTAQQAQRLLNEQALSGVGIMAFCRDHGISYARLKYWRGRLAIRRDTSPVQSGFVEVVPRASLSMPSNAHEASAGVVTRIAPFLLRRTKKIVAPELPSRTESVVTIALKGGQRALYDSVRLAMDERGRISKCWKR